MERVPPADSGSGASVEFHDVVLPDGRTAAVEVTDSEFVIGTTRLRRWVVPVIAVVLAVHVVLVVNTTILGTPPFTPLYLFLALLALLAPQARTCDMLRRPLAGIRAIEVAERRISIRTVDDTVVLLPKSWQHERLAALLRSRAPHVRDDEPIAAQDTARDVHALEDDRIGWVPYGHTPGYTLAGAGALAVGVVLSIWSQLDATAPVFTMDVAWTAVSLAFVLWVMDRNSWYWLRRRLERASGSGDAPVTVKLRRKRTASRLRGWTSVTAEPTPHGIAFVERHVDLFECVVVVGVACGTSTALLGRPDVLAAIVAYVFLTTSGYPRKRYTVEEVLAEDLLEFEDDRGRGVLRIREAKGAREYGVRYQVRGRDRWLALLRAAAPEARVHEPVRVHGVGGAPSVNLSSVHDRLVELGEREATVIRRDD